MAWRRIGDNLNICRSDICIYMYKYEFVATFIYLQVASIDVFHYSAGPGL